MPMSAEAQATFDLNVNAYFEALPRLVDDCGGQYVVISDARVLQVLRTREDAYTAAYEYCGQGDFLVKQILAADLKREAQSGVCPS